MQSHDCNGPTLPGLAPRPGYSNRPTDVTFRGLHVPKLVPGYNTVIGGHFITVFIPSCATPERSQETQDSNDHMQATHEQISLSHQAPGGPDAKNFSSLFPRSWPCSDGTVGVRVAPSVEACDRQQTRNSKIVCHRLSPVPESIVISQRPPLLSTPELWQTNSMDEETFDHDSVFEEALEICVDPYVPLTRQRVWTRFIKEKTAAIKGNTNVLFTRLRRLLTIPSPRD